MTTRDVLIFDTTLRDGEQAPGNSLSPEEKLRLARQLDALGVDVMEAGFPAASEGDYRSVREIAAELTAAGGGGPGPLQRARHRARRRGDPPAARGRLHIFISTSDLHIQEKLKTTRDDVLERARAAIRQARQYTDDVEFSAEDASRTDPDFLCRMVELAIAEGARTVNLPDTVGYAMPGEYAAMFRDVRARVPGADGVVLSAHCHDDLGMAVANSLAAIEAGAGQVECTVNGIGERAGNTALEEVVMASQVRGPLLGFRCNVDSREIYRTSQLLSYLTGVFPQPNKAIVGRNAFAHEAGIHQHGMLQNVLTYEIIRPEMVGIPRSTLVLGKHSGRHALERRFRELGYELNDVQLAEVYRQFSTLADRKREILDEDLLALVHESFHDAPEEYQLTHLARRLRQHHPHGGSQDDRALGRRAERARHRRRADLRGVHRHQRHPRPPHRGRSASRSARSRRAATASARCSSRPRWTGSRSRETAPPPTSSRPARARWCTRSTRRTTPSSWRRAV